MQEEALQALDRASQAATSLLALFCLQVQVVEVGVDVPAASMILVEHADRFGLAQLHQLRGRVGRGTRPSTAYLVADSADSMERLRVSRVLGQPALPSLAPNWCMYCMGVGLLSGLPAVTGVGRARAWQRVSWQK